jgi:hypothetical protein
MNEDGMDPTDDRTLAPDGPDAESAEADDELLLAELREVVGRVDPLSPDMVAAARASFVWRTIDAELAQLSQDTVLDADRMALVRGTGAPELRTFEAPGLTVEVETVAVADGVRLLGQLVPAGPGEVEIRHPDGTIRVEADDMGRFAAEGMPPGPVSLRCRAAGAVVDTDWFLA